MPLFEIEHVAPDLPEPSFNISPPGPIVIVVEPAPDGDSNNDGGRRLEAAKWGLVPRFAKTPTSGPAPTNARSEVLATNGMYRSAFKRQRTLIPADGFYEWLPRDDGKQPYYASNPDGGVLALGGLYEWWHHELLSATIIVQPSTGPLAPVHQKMPLIIPPDLWDDWLDPATELSPTAYEHVLRQGVEAANRLDVWPVSRAVNSTRDGQRQDGPQLTARVDA